MEESALALHTFVTSSELDLGQSESVTKMERSVHVGIWNGSEPLGVLCSDLIWCHIDEAIILRGGVDVKDMLLGPVILGLLFELLEEVTFRGVFELDRTAGASVLGGIFRRHGDGCESSVESNRSWRKEKLSRSCSRGENANGPWTRLQAKDRKMRRVDVVPQSSTDGLVPMG